jgi:hypothetical protein
VIGTKQAGNISSRVKNSARSPSSVICQSRYAAAHSATKKAKMPNCRFSRLFRLRSPTAKARSIAARKFTNEVMIR